MKNLIIPLFAILSLAVSCAGSGEGKEDKDQSSASEKEIVYTPTKTVEGEECYTMDATILLNGLNITDSIRALQLIPKINNGKADGIDARMNMKKGYASTIVKYGTSFYHVENRRVIKVVVHDSVLNLNGVTAGSDFETFEKKFGVQTKFDPAVQLVTGKEELLKFYFSDKRQVDSIVYEKL